MIELLVFAGILLWMASASAMASERLNTPINERQANWRKLSLGLSRDEVAALLGPGMQEYPDQRWGYADDASVTFDEKGRLMRWCEPSRW